MYFFQFSIPKFDGDMCTIIFLGFLSRLIASMYQCHLEPVVCGIWAGEPIV